MLNTREPPNLRVLRLEQLDDPDDRLCRETAVDQGGNKKKGLPRNPFSFKEGSGKGQGRKRSYKYPFDTSQLDLWGFNGRSGKFG